MAGIGAIGGGLSPYTESSRTRLVEPSGGNFTGLSGARTGREEAAFAPGNAAEDTSRSAGAAQELSEDEQKQVDELKQRDREVRQHEQAHLAAAGRYAQGGPQFEFTTGPDGRRYATGGHVSIDVSPARTPEATIQKAQVIRRAALAPAEPSGADRSVAAAASQLETEARREIQESRQEEAQGDQAGEAQAPGDASGAAQGADPLVPPPALSQKNFSQYQPDSSGGGGAISRVGRLDVLA